MVAYVLSAAVRDSADVLRLPGAISRGWTLLGTIGDAAHLRGTGDHTPWSTWVGHTGAPVRGYLYAIDVGMPRDDQVAFYRWLIDQLKIGGCDEIKFVNFGYTPQGGPAQINLQTTESVRLARSGKLRPSKSPESHLGHVHISFETANTHKTDGTLRQFLTHMEGGEKMSDDPDPMKSETVCPKDIAEKYGLLPGTKSTFERVLWATYGAVLAILNTIKKK